MKDLSDENEHNKAVTKVRNAVELQKVDLKFIMNSEQGRRFIYDLLTDTHMYSTSFTGNSTTFFKEGERNIGIRLMTRIHETCLDEYMHMLKEAKMRTKQND
jgi:hypothetical protein